jgi:hypothetical protein
MIVTDAVFINFVLDKSGSMNSIRDDTIGGFNQFREEQRLSGESLDQQTKMSLTLFDTEHDVRYTATDIAAVPALDEETYRPGGNTALYDAVGTSVRALEDLAPEGKVLFVILTDGLENSSREWNRESIFNLIKEKREKSGWEFVFLGADQDAYAAADAMSVGRASTLSHARGQSRAVYERLSQATSAWRSGQTAEVDVSQYQEEFDEKDRPEA